MRRHAIPTLACLWALLATGCRPEPPAPRVLVLERFLPVSRQGVFLNEDLVLTFSDELDRDSITEDSFRVLDDQGRPARGRRLLTGRTLRFQPAPVLEPDLEGGGYRPGTSYRVFLRGFPWLGAVRSVEGAPLAGSLELPFRTVAVQGLAAGERGQVFDDASPASSHGLRLATPRDRRPRRDPEAWVLYPDDPIWLTCEEPLDPSTLRDADFRLRLVETDRRVPVRARLVTNHDEDEAPLREPCARIELVPLERLEPGTWLRLDFAPDFALRDFGGNPVWVPGPGFSRGETLVVEEDPGRGPEDRLDLDFLDSGRFIPVAVEGADGTALWGLEGTVGVRFPAAAGDGADGRVVLGGGEGPRQVSATRLTLPRGERCVLPTGGLVVLRAQGTLRLAGELVRAAGESGADPPSLGRLSMPRQELGAWLERRAEAADEWTVLVAGGDLVIEDEGIVDVATPLLLVAGGRIRAEGSVRQVPENALWLLGRGGSLEFGLSASTPNLVIDPPLENPLVEPLRFAAVSSQIPRSERQVRWRSPVVVGHPGSGSYRVRYLLASDGRYDPARAVDHPRLLDGEGAIRLLVELELPPAAVAREWDPPWIDSIHLSWEPLEESR